MADPRRLFDSKDVEAAGLYANLITGGLEDFYPLKVDASGYLLVSMTVGSVSLSSTASTITNAVGNPVNVSLTSTVVSVTLPPALTTTSSTINNAVGNPVNVSLTSTAVTIANTAGTVTNSVSTIAIMSKTLTGSSGSISTTFTTIFTPTNRAKIYAFSFTTTSASEVTVLVCDGAFANAKEYWRATLMAPAGSNAGANLSVSPPAWLFASRSTSAVTISLSTAVLVHYSLSLFDEA